MRKYQCKWHVCSVEPHSRDCYPPYVTNGYVSKCKRFKSGVRNKGMCKFLEVRHEN